MLSHGERNLVKWVAKVSPWLAPLPSGFFVARVSLKHLDLPILVGVVTGVIIELLGIASIHTWLWLSDWNANKRKVDPDAPATFAAFLGVFYLLATISLTVVLEVQPLLSTYAPAMFPLLAIVGALNLALIAQQEQREMVLEREHRERQDRRKFGKPVHPFVTGIEPDQPVDSAKTIADDGLQVSWRAGPQRSTSRKWR